MGCMYYIIYSYFNYFNSIDAFKKENERARRKIRATERTPSRYTSVIDFKDSSVIQRPSQAPFLEGCSNLISKGMLCVGNIRTVNGHLSSLRMLL